MTKEEFIERLKSIDKAPFLFLGSGFSRHYTDSPTWEAILEKFSKKPLNQYKSILNTNSLPLIATELSKDLTCDFWKLPADNDFVIRHRNDIKDQSSVLKIRIAEYLKELSEKPFDSSFCDELKMLSNLSIDGIITTNWDNTIERVFPKYKTFVGQKELLFSSTFSIGEIYKIHGSFCEPSSMILTKEDYEGFKDKYPYLAAKLITIFVEHPIIFMGYSLSDPNIQDLLKSIVKCLDTKHISKLQNNLIFVEWKKNEDGINIDKYDISMNDGVLLPVIRVQTCDFKRVYECLAYYERKIPANVLREYKKQFYDIVVSEKPECNILALSDEKVDVDSKIQVVYGFGAIDKYMTANGYIGLTAIDIMLDVIREGNHYDATMVLKKCVPLIIKKSPNIFIPIYKYLSSIGIHSDVDYKRKMLNLNYKLKKQNDFVSYRSFTDKDKRKSLSEAIQTYNEDERWKAIALIPFLEINDEELSLLASFIADNVGEYLYKKHSKATFMRKLICFYDWKKYGWSS